MRISDWSSDVCSSDLITPGYKIGKDGLEKYFQEMLKGEPGARRVEVTARGKVVRDLSTQPDVQGKTVHLTIDAGLQEYVARRMGRESGAAVRSEEHTSELQSLMRISYDVFCLKKKKQTIAERNTTPSKYE